VIVLSLEQRPVLRAYDEFEDLPNNRTLTVYSLAEIAVEKTVALCWLMSGTRWRL
jgi:hypothetical protein